MTDDKSKLLRYIPHVAIPLAIVAAGILVQMALASLKKEPPREEMKEIPLDVEVKKAVLEDVEVVVTGYGDIRSLSTVPITPKVAGEVVEVHPNLKMGGLVRKDEVLFRIDPVDYELAKAQGEAEVARIENMLALLKRQFEIDKGRVGTYQRTMELAEAEFKKDKTLFEKEDIGSDSMVNASEINYNRARDAYDQIQQAIELYPLKVKEAENGLLSGKAALAKADLALSRTVERAPFDARIKLSQVEVGQVIAPGVVAIALADDSALEISVPLDSRDARSWLQFKTDRPEEAELQWFGELQPVDCRIKWTESPKEHVWTGQISRVERMDQMTRTINVCIRIEKTQDSSIAFPLVEGMYCLVEIPGRMLEKVVCLPRWAVTFEDEVYVANAENRIEKRKVTVARRQGDEALVTAGIAPGEMVIITRLANPLPGTLVTFTDSDGASGGEPVSQ